MDNAMAQATSAADAPTAQAAAEREQQHSHGASPVIASPKRGKMSFN
jgi:hypothetical protein